MCGISALYRFTNISSNDCLKLEAMNKEMAYRGPNEKGVWHDDICGLAHTRLSIIGLENGHQPIFNEDRSLVLVCNGEIYNYKDLRSSLKQKGHLFSTDSDSEVIIHLYEEYGIDALQHLRGMFAFCLWDSNINRLFSARDRVGEKTLYFSQLPTGVIFSTELKAILKYYISKPQINIKSLAEAIRYNFPIDLRNTYIEQIKRLQAGEYALVDADGIQLHTYWKKHQSKVFDGSKEEAKQEVLRLMRESVSNCLQSDVPVAVLLSGGIDSSAIAAFARECRKDVHVITAGYKGNFDCDEREVARRFAKEKGLIYHEVELDVSDFKNLFDEYVQYIDEPVCDVSSMSQWALYKKAKELGFTVLLGGIGGDELFYGYPYYNRLANAYMLRKQHYDLLPWKGKKKDYLKFVLHNLKPILFAGYPMKLDDSIPVHWTYDDYRKFAKDAKLYLNCEVEEFESVDVHFSFAEDANIDAVYDFMFTRFMNTQCLYLADRLGMGNSVEIRSPFVDYKIVEFVSTLPVFVKYDEKCPKRFLKDALYGILPDYILYAQKKGFTPPFDFINQLNKEYEYKCIKSLHTFYNSMLADKLISLLIKP